MRGCIVTRRDKNGEPLYYAVATIGDKPIWRKAGLNKKDAERFLTEWVSDIHGGTYVKPRNILFRDFAEEWLQKYALGVVKESTFRNYRSIIQNHISPQLGHYPITQITPKAIQEFLVWLVQSGRSKKTANNVLVLLKTMLTYGVQFSSLRVNPAFNVKPFRVEEQEQDFLQPHEVGLLLKHADEPFKTLFLTAVLTGMRRGELLGLMRSDIDWVNDRIFVRRALYWLTNTEKRERRTPKRFVLTTPKTKRSNRAIVMSPILKKALQIHLINSPENELDLVFCNRNGGPLDPDNFVKREFHAALDRAGLRRIRFHDFRHTFSSLLIHIEPNPKLIQSQLGHASIQTTIDRYGHLFPIDHKALGTKLDNFVFSLPDNSQTVVQPLNLTKI